MTPPFVVFSLPRSRSAWLSKFLSYGPFHCAHDELRHCRSLADVESWLAQPCTGTCETAASPFWRLLKPGVRVVTVTRPVDEVLASLRRGGLVFEDAVMRPVLRHHEAKLRQIAARLPDVLTVTFEALRDEATCARVFEHCLGLPHDSAWWQRWAGENVQRNMQEFLRYAIAYAPQTEALRRLARHEMMRRLHRPAVMDGVTFQREPLRRAFSDRDGIRLMSEECVMLGEQPEAWREMNIPMFQRLEARGNLHIYTARSNGRMFGYLVTALGEAFHARGQVEADQVSFFADPSWPGLGRKLQQASIEDLRARGVTRVLMFQPDQTRVGLVYRRLGAKQTGQRFVLELQ